MRYGLFIFSLAILINLINQLDHYRKKLILRLYCQLYCFTTTIRLIYMNTHSLSTLSVITRSLSNLDPEQAILAIHTFSQNEDVNHPDIQSALPPYLMHNDSDEDCAKLITLLVANGYKPTNKDIITAVSYCTPFVLNAFLHLLDSDLIPEKKKLVTHAFKAQNYDNAQHLINNGYHFSENPNDMYLSSLFKHSFKGIELYFNYHTISLSSLIASNALYNLGRTFDSELVAYMIQEPKLQALLSHPETIRGMYSAGNIDLYIQLTDKGINIDAKTLAFRALSQSEVINILDHKLQSEARALEYINNSPFFANSLRTLIATLAWACKHRYNKVSDVVNKKIKEMQAHDNENSFYPRLARHTFSLIFNCNNINLIDLNLIVFLNEIQAHNNNNTNIMKQALIEAIGAKLLKSNDVMLADSFRVLLYLECLNIELNEDDLNTLFFLFYSNPLPLPHEVAYKPFYELIRFLGSIYPDFTKSAALSAFPMRHLSHETIYSMFDANETIHLERLTVRPVAQISLWMQFISDNDKDEAINTLKNTSAKTRNLLAAVLNSNNTEFATYIHQG